ncbi:helix-turn-helix transcriptional regulator [Herbaspirillum sp. RU 5E]|nr:helix-turn-helix transcriptional regulator [Herbaspirillum sp. RU 5E]
MKIGEKIRLIRKARDLNLADIENAIGMANGNLSRIERGAQWPSEETLKEIATALGVHVSAFFLPEDGLDGVMQNIEKPSPDDVIDDLMQLIILFRSLGPDERQYVLDSARTARVGPSKAGGARQS